MAFRSHLARSLDFSRNSNRLIVGLTLVAAVAAGVVVWDGGDTDVLLAPVFTFVIWALIRELDPDHDSTAIIGAFVAGIWVLAGLDPNGWITVAGLMVAARLVVSSTGRRPLPADLAATVLVAALVSFTAAGWVAGFGIALAIYVDDRMAEEQRTMSVVAAAVAAVAASGVATFAGVFPKQLPDIRPPLVLAIGALALISFVREPETPTSLVDSRRKTPLSTARLHAARGLVGIAVFVAAVLAGQEAETTGVAAVAVALVLGSNELERIRRSGL